MQPLTLKEFQEYAKKASKVSVFEEIPAGELTPSIVYTLLNKAYQKEGMILENVSEDSTHRYAYICFEPLESLVIPYGSTLQPLHELRNIQAQFHYAIRPDVAHLITKAIGFITYDAAASFEGISHHVDENTLPLCLFHFYATSITFDYTNKTILISTIANVNTEVETAYYQAREKIQNIISLLTTISSSVSELVNNKKIVGDVEVDISDSDFIQMVSKAKEYIMRGDAFQIVLSRSFKRRYAATPLFIYKILREVSPTPFMFYFPLKTQTIIGASPERLVRVHQGEVSVNPIAGTHKRTNDQLDADISADLLNTKKELAEHMMLVDLARNDVGAVCKPGSVTVNELLKVKHYSHVSHITSTVTGSLHENYDAFDALKATIPAGTLSGAPKIRAMQIIAELEKTSRGLYGGAICRIDLANNFDSCIAIRMAVLQDGVATIRTGAGIVYDSDPYAEAQETYQKASALLTALAIAHGEKTT